MNKPLVSVLMTVYNREKYIAEAIESVLASTYHNFELILVDDGSKDKSVKIAKTFEKLDNRIKVFVNEKNLGDYPNRNHAASLAKGKYLKYVDADDLIYPHGLEQLVYYMEQFPNSSYGLCSIKQDKNKIYPYQLSPKLAYEKHYFQVPIFERAPLSAIINRDAFLSVGGFSGKQHLGDYELWHILSKKGTVVLMPPGIVWHREHDDQQMNDNRTDPYVPFKYLLNSLEHLNAKDCPLENAEKKEAILLINKKINRSILSAAKHHSIKKSIQMFKAKNNSI
ncbi:glycosyltransferase (GT2) [Formosa agariphila KMM 3901]|uniref:Glycosyltransferase (GT2) n=1 Tax=Formosa agariphila (strain DSM 15362 / KCTC 12365 / LMG 23005 / KMM 3901 / M-2Alg 35-1) TaxID=1347342 RepID=T2KPF6_FORAG|nr:glycosyltransferase family 2 protein [Formosa agariphila]CDF80635.1 glycosyltransferase (GT2) [Formosa agariphila KMM 3901]